MRNKFLVGQTLEQFGERKFQLIEADTADEAKIKFVKEQDLIDFDFEEYLISKSQFESFAGRFWQETLPNQSLFLGVGQTTSREKFEEKIRKFFGNNPEYAELYLNEYFSDADEIDLDTFPDEMKIMIYINSEYEQITAFDLNELHLKPKKRRR